MHVKVKEVGRAGVWRAISDIDAQLHQARRNLKLAEHDILRLESEVRKLKEKMEGI